MYLYIFLDQRPWVQCILPPPLQLLQVTLPNLLHEVQLLYTVPKLRPVPPQLMHRLVPNPPPPPQVMQVVYS